MPNFVKSPFYNNKEEKEVFLNNNRQFYKDLGCTPDEIEQIIQDQLESSPYSVNEGMMLATIDEHLKAEIAMKEKYACFSGRTLSEFGRILDAMCLPETCPENIQHNERLAMKNQTPQGQVEILREALFELGQITPAIAQEARKDPAVFSRYSRGLRMGFAVRSLINCIAAVKKNPGYNVDSAALEAALPEAAVLHLEKNVAFYQDFSFFRNCALLYNNKYQYLLPLAADFMEKHPNVETNLKADMDFLNIPVFRLPSAMSASQYTAPSREVRTFFEQVQTQICNEGKNPVAAAKRIDQLSPKYNILDEIYSIDSVNFSFDHISAKVKSNREHNRDLLKNALPALIKYAKSNYSKPLPQAADEMASLLRSGNMLFHTNKNYGEMLRLMDAIRLITDKQKNSSKGNAKKVNTLTVPDKAKLAEYLKKLDKAAVKYMEAKVKDNDKYSPKALERIHAARLCNAFAKGRLRDLTLEMNEDLKKMEPTNILTTGNARYVLSQARADYSRKYTLQNFVKCLTYARLVDSMEKNGSRPILQDEAVSALATAMGKYKLLYNNDADFKDAVDNGRFKQAVNAIVPATKALEVKLTASRSGEAHELEGSQPKQAPQFNPPILGNAG